MSDKALQRKALIVDTMIERLEELKQDREETKAELKKALAEDKTFWYCMWSERVVKLSDEIVLLEKFLKIGLEEG